jgi:ubiquinone/menaquinone biosynthesis C-methylase UbiE
MNRFDKSAEQWDAEERRVNLAKSVFNSIKEKIKLKNDLTIADIGTGTGLLLIQFLPFAKQIDGFDNSQGMLNVLSEKIKQNKIENVTLHQFNADKDELPENKYDLVVSSMTFHHIEKTEEILRKIYKSLKIGGEMCIADLESEDGTFHSEMTDDIFHKGFDKSDFVSIMEKVGFKNSETKTAFSVIRSEKSFSIFTAYGKKESNLQSF